MADQKSTQSFLDISEVRDGVVVMKDGNLRAILAVSSVNFALKSEDEQNAIIASYQNFLNSLDFPIQIIMQSRRMDINPYLDLMRERLSTVTNRLLQIQISEYTEFIQKLVETAHIMSKTFFVVVPFNYNKVTEGFLSKFSKVFGSNKAVTVGAKAFDEHRKKLMERTGFVQGQLSSMGLGAIQLNTEEIIELMYSSYNMGSASALHADSLNKIEIR